MIQLLNLIQPHPYWQIFHSLALNLHFLFSPTGSNLYVFSQAILYFTVDQIIRRFAIWIETVISIFLASL